MKKLMMILLIAVAASAASAQTKMSGDSKTEAQIITLEKKGWEAWKNKDAKWFQTAMADDALHFDATGEMNKTQFVKAIADCDVKSVGLDNFKFLMLDKNSALLTFIGTQDAVCGGQKQPSTVRSTSVYVRRGGKWQNIFYSEAAATQ